MVFERTKNARRNIIFAFLNKMITLLCPFLIRTIIIRRLGADFLGLSSLFASILQVLNLTELGFSSAIVFCLYKPIAENDKEKICMIMNYYRKIYFVIGITILSLGLILMPFLKYFIKGGGPADINIYVLFLIYLGNTVLSYLLFAYKGALLIAFQRSDVSSNINSVVSLFTYFIQIIVLFITANYYLYMLVILISTLLLNFFTYFYTKKLFPDIVCKGKLTQDVKIDIKNRIKGLMIGKVTSVTRNAFDSIFISLFFGLFETAVYNNYYYILNAVSGFIVIILPSISAGIGNSVAVETQEKNFNDFEKINFVYMWITGFCTICLACLYQTFSEIAFGASMLFPIFTVLLFCMYFYVLRMGDCLWLYTESNGLWWQCRYISISEAITNIVLNFLLGKLFGVNGIILGTLISILFITSILGARITYNYYFTNYKVSRYLLKHLFYFICTLINLAVTFIICHLISLYIRNLLLLLFVKVVVCFVLSNFLYVILYRRLRLFKVSVNWVVSIIKKR